jgi:cysteinyl-tRNA synthetase
MSKSLKNFITIKEALKDFTGRQIRIMVLMHKWDMTFNFVSEAMPEAVEKERQFNEFFLSYKAAIRNYDYNVSQHWRQEDFKINTLLCEYQDKIHKAICNNFDTPSAITYLGELITQFNGYMKDEQNLKATILTKAANYVHLILQSFGVIGDTPLGFSAQKGNVVDEEQVITPLMNILTKFRDDIKLAAGNGPKEIFNLCDQLRDVALPELGIRLEDKGKDKPSIWKKEDPEKLKMEIASKGEEKKRKEEEKKKKAAEELKKKMTPASEYFKQMTDNYSQFDEQGIPTHNAAGKELSKETISKLKKDYAKQDKIHKKWLETEAKKE